MEEQEQDLFTETQNNSLLAAFGWWEKKRIIYNLVVGATGLICIFYLGFPVFWLAVVFYGIIANLCYSLGFLIEVGARYYFGSNMDFNNKRQVLFGIGLALSILITAGIPFGLAFITLIL